MRNPVKTPVVGDRWLTKHGHRVEVVAVFAAAGGAVSLRILEEDTDGSNGWEHRVGWVWFSALVEVGTLVRSEDGCSWDGRIDAAPPPG